MFLLVIVAGVFALQNQSVTDIKFLRTTWETSQSIVILIAVAAGFFAGVLTMVPGSIRKWRKIKGLEKELGGSKKRPVEEGVRKEEEPEEEIEEERAGEENEEGPSE